MSFVGLTWDHPRGYDALAEAARRVNADREFPLIEWARQPLEGFESAPIADLAARYDLLVLDHPHIGEAVAEDCLIPLEDLFDADTIARWRAQSIGPSMASYHWQGRSFAVPLDVATQVMARRADRIGPPPASWEAIEDLALRQPVALSLGGPHAFLNLISLAAGHGHVIAGEDMLSDDAAVDAIEKLGRLARLAPEGSDALNPIALLRAMATGEEIALVPLIFGYVTYAQSGLGPHLVSFSDTLRAPGGFGGVLGGTGIGFTRRSVPSRDLLDHVEWLMESCTQTEFFPAFHGQPSARMAWLDRGVNAASHDFYAATAGTAEHALMRPRFDGYIAFQNAASDVLRTAFKSNRDVRKTLIDIRSLWQAARRNARGSLDDNRMIS